MGLLDGVSLGISKVLDSIDFFLGFNWKEPLDILEFELVKLVKESGKEEKDFSFAESQLLGQNLCDSIIAFW